MKNYDKSRELSYLSYWNLNNLYGWAMSQRFPANSFKWVEDLSQFDEGLRKSYNEKSKEGYFLKLDVQCSENLHNI